MAKLTLCRIDDRLIHGQIIVKWSKSVPVDRILIVDDKFAKDPFMVSLYKATAPKHLKFSMLSLSDTAEKWKAGFFKEENILLLTRTVDVMKGLIEADIPIDEVNVGGIASKASSVVVAGSISITKDDVEGLKAIEDRGKHVYFKMTPEDAGMELSTVINKYFK
ncbi:PTS system mannose/fructose/N-acetylgalactosamine-transporter subunit IIB [Clostridium polynesiense]|uniref:PTS system mannose/fructose/N-acetylgalactosamine-transporter subunit IIB n=1 Tax=Clostridium polynesiense TaxID=1325933 RepID=UPI00058C63A4|nr:PTS sugar transporter subunit IIB [Clostridium polynesiense]